MESAHQAACVLDFSPWEEALDLVEGQPRPKVQLHAPFDCALQVFQ
jgi:hypothetical protein